MPRKNIINNDCQFLEPVLSVCTGPFRPDGCAYMSNPTSCCMHETGHKPLYTKLEEEDERSETIMDFAERVRQELTSMGIKYEELGSTQIMPEDF